MENSCRANSYTDFQQPSAEFSSEPCTCYPIGTARKTVLFHRILLLYYYGFEAGLNMGQKRKAVTGAVGKRISAAVIRSDRRREQIATRKALAISDYLNSFHREKVSRTTLENRQELEKAGLGGHFDAEREIRRLEEQSGGLEALLIAQAERAAARRKAAEQVRRGVTAQTVTDRTDGLKTA